jgi:hypothetical protein
MFAHILPRRLLYAIPLPSGRKRRAFALFFMAFAPSNMARMQLI